MALAILGLVGQPAWAQTATTGVIEGTVKDANGQPVQGAKVTAIGPQTPATASTDAGGRFVFLQLVPGKYDVRVEKEGFQTVVQKGIELAAKSRVHLPFVLSPGKVEEVTVAVEAPLIDPKSTTAGHVFRPDDFQNYLPVQHSFTESFAIAPGVVSGLGTGTGNFSISGSSGLENSYIVDGVNITNTGYGGVGSYNIVYGSLGSGVTYDFLEEVQIKTGGIDVEYGQATGGVVNTVVKSGTNELSGSVAVFFTPADGRGEFRDIRRSNGAVNLFEEEQRDFSASVGGPILKDKLFYFAAYNPVRTDTSADISAAPIESGAPFLFDTFPSGQTTYPAVGLGPQERKRTNNNWAVKFTWYASANHRLELTGFGDPSDGDRGPQRFGSLRNLEFASGGGQSEIEFGANNYSLKYDAVFTPNFFMQFQAARHDGKFRETSVLNKHNVTDRRQELAFLFPQLFSPTGTRPPAPTLWTNGGAGFLSNADDINDQFRVQATWLLGNHEVVAGAQYDNIEYTDDQAYSGEPTEFLIPLDGDGDGLFTAVGSSVECPGDNPGFDCWVRLTSTSGTIIHRRGGSHWRSVRARFFPTPPPTKTKDVAFFAKDTFSITPRVSFKFGVRASRQKIEGAGGFSLPLNAAREPVTTTYSPGRYTFDWVYAPALGVTFDVKGDGRSKLYGNLRRYVERIPNDLAVRSLSNEVGLTRYRWNAYDYVTGTPSSPRVMTNGNDPIFFQGLETTQIEPGTKLPYVDEVLLGWQQEVGKDTSIEVRAIYREQGRVLEDVQYNSIESIQNFYYGSGYYYPYDPFPGFSPAPFGAYFLANPGENTRTGVNGETIPKGVRKYKALEFIVNKRFSDRWQLYGNFRVGRLRGNYEGLFRNDNGQSDPNITSLFDFPLSPLTEGQFRNGPLNTDRPYVAKLFGRYAWDNGLTLGAAFTWESGVPRTPLLAHPIYINAGELPGSNPTYGWWSLGDDPLVPGPCDGALFFNRGSASDFGNDVCFVQVLPMLVDYERVGRGALGRTPDIARFDLSLGWRKSLGKRGDFTISGTVFNVFGFREVELLDDDVELTAGTPNNDFNTVIGYQEPRAVRVVARWAF